MKDDKIERINVLARKQRAEGLTDEEKAEQQILRQEYINSIKSSLRSTLDNTVIVDSDGNSKK